VASDAGVCGEGISASITWLITAFLILLAILIASSRSRYVDLDLSETPDECGTKGGGIGSSLSISGGVGVCHFAGVGGADLTFGAEGGGGAGGCEGVYCMSSPS